MVMIMRRVLLPAVTLACCWLFNQQWILRTMDPFTSLRSGLEAFGYDSSQARFVAGEYRVAALGVEAEARFVVDDFPGQEIEICGVRSLAFGDWTIRSSQLLDRRSGAASTPSVPGSED